MRPPATPFSPLPSDATLADVIAKVNALIESINEMWPPDEPPIETR